MNAKEIFNRALDADPKDRVEVLDEACGDNAELRLKVESLLKFHDSGRKLLEAHPILADGPFAPQLKRGEFGHYELLEEVGRGGQGAVYRIRWLNFLASFS